MITLRQDLGATMGVRLNLDASAAKGILERQGISKVRHIDVNVLWLQQQVAKKIVPLIKVDGTANCSDLLTKHLAAHVQRKHAEMMRLEFRDGRSQMAAQLHVLDRVQPQEEFNDEGGTDRWEERGEQGRWTRVNRTPRAALFNPRRVARGPGRGSRLSIIRETVGIDETGRKFSFSDDWTKSKESPVLGRRWTGMTTFRTVSFDDKRYGGDQRRQRERAGSERFRCTVLAVGSGNAQAGASKSGVQLGN